MELKDKIILVTGSSQGIGKETVLEFAKKGAKVVVTYNSNKEKAEDVLKEGNKHSNCILFHLDVKDEKSIENAFEKIKREFGKLDVLINNAGVIRWKEFSKQNKEDIEDQIETNLIGLIKTTRIFLPLLSKQKDAVIVNISSDAGKEAYENLTVYCATKFGVRGFTQALAKELPKGIKVFSVNPGMTATQMTDYEGIPPKKVAELIVKTAKGEMEIPSGGDVDVWKLI
ncbi:MAG: SDR family oxidoreductase [Nanoarchaeota archaeon]|nr:SDR family oxidoreductase [Nanoarchaeota archaeon]